MPCAPSSHASAVHGLQRCVVAQGLEVSRGEVLQHKVVQAQVRNQTLQLRVLLLQLLQPLRLVYLQPAVLLAPTEVRLLYDPGFLTCQSRRLPVCYGHFDLTQQIYHLLRLVFLSSSYKPSLSSVSFIHWHISSRALQPLYLNNLPSGLFKRDFSRQVSLTAGLPKWRAS